MVKLEYSREEALKKIKSEFERLDLGPNPTQVQYKKLKGQPTIPWIREHLKLTWRELLAELGYETSHTLVQNVDEWNNMATTDLDALVMKFMAEHNIANRADFLREAKSTIVPNSDYLSKRFGGRKVGELLERSFETYGVPSTVVVRQWAYLTDDEVLDHINYEVEVNGLNTKGSYEENHDPRISPSYSYMARRFGGSHKLYDAYRRRFGKEMFILGPTSKRNSTKRG